MNRIFIAVERKWFAKCVEEYLGHICDCFIADITKDCRVVKITGKGSLGSKNKDKKLCSNRLLFL